MVCASVHPAPAKRHARREPARAHRCTVRRGVGAWRPQALLPLLKPDEGRVVTVSSRAGTLDILRSAALRERCGQSFGPVVWASRLGHVGLLLSSAQQLSRCGAGGGARRPRAWWSRGACCRSGLPTPAAGRSWTGWPRSLWRWWRAARTWPRRAGPGAVWAGGAHRDERPALWLVPTPCESPCWARRSMYGVSKALISAYMRVLAKQVAPRGVKVATCCPG